MNEEDREQARQKVKKVYGNDSMSEDAVMKEYFTEGLTNKTRWAVKDPEKKITLSKNAEQGLEDLLQSKGSNIKAFTSNITKTRPTEKNITQMMEKSVDPKLQKPMGELVEAIKSMGDGLSAIDNVRGSFEDLKNTLDRNNRLVEENVEAYKKNSNELNNLAGKFKSNLFRGTGRPLWRGDGYKDV